MKYRIDEGPFSFGPGFVLGLTDAQAEPRRHRLEPREDGVYGVIEPVEFKAGEEVEVIAGDVGRAALDRMTELGGDPPEPPEDEHPTRRRRR